MAGNNIRKYKKPLNINIGTICFAVILIYIFICVFMYFTQKHIVGYEVKAGSLSVSNVYEGIALREETIVTADKSGYVNYYAKEGEKVGCGNTVCSIDETGELQSYVPKDENAFAGFTNQDIAEIKNEIDVFSTSFSPADFSGVYDFKYSISGSVLKFANRNILNSIGELTGDGSNGLISLCNAPESGIVIYSTDGFESVSSADVCADWFSKENYEKKQLINNEIIDAGEPIYKLSDSEKWSIIIPIDKERANELLEEEYVKVRFLKNRYESWGEVEVLEDSQNNTYVELHFTNSMITFSTERFINIELITDKETGLKVPNSAIIDRSFYLVPTEYITKGGNNNSDGVIKQNYSEDGTMLPEFVPVTIYNEVDGEYYIDSSMLEIGDRINQPDAANDYTISKSAELTGVYNINKGYADFKQIKVLNQNDEYSIIESNTKYGLVPYDYIALDAESIEADEFIYD